jgi:hypothetical protein
MIEKVQYIEIFNSNPDIDTLSKFAEEYLIIIDDTFSLQNLLNYEDNADSILSAYLPEDERTIAEVGLLRTPVKIKVPVEQIEDEILPTLGNFEEEVKNFYAFYDERVKDLLNHEGYKPLYDANSTQSKNQGKSFRIFNNATVWVYSKALGNKLVNLTPFIQNLTSSVGKNGGSFSVVLSPLVGYYEESSQEWTFDRNSFMSHLQDDYINYTQRETLFEQKNNNDGESEMRQKKLFFHNILTSNDVVFI